MSALRRFYRRPQKLKLNVENKELLFDSSIAFTIRIGAAVSVFLMNLVVARQLGSSSSGIFFLCYAIITVLSTLVRMGGDNLLVRYVGIYGTEQKWRTVRLIVNEVAKKTLFIAVGVSAVLLPFYSIIARDVFHKPDVAGTLFWMLLAMPLFAIHTLFAFAFQGLKKVLMSVSVQNIMVPVILSALILILRPHDPVLVAKLYFASSVLTVLITLFSWYRIAPAGTTNETPALPDNFWKSSYHLWTFVIFQMALQWGGQFIAGIYSSQRDLAWLAVAQRTSMLISFILVAINLISAPRFASMYKQGKKENLKRYAINSTRVMVLFSTPIVLVMVIFPKFIMSFFGPGFQGGAPMLVFLCLGQYVNVLTGSVSQLLMMSGHEKDMRNIQIFVGIFCTILNFVLIRTYGAYGAAIATALSIAIQNLIFVGMVQKRLGFNTLAIWKR